MSLDLLDEEEIEKLYKMFDEKIVTTISKKIEPTINKINELEAKRIKVIYEIIAACRSRDRNAYENGLKFKDEIETELVKYRVSIRDRLNKKEREYLLKLIYIFDSKNYIPPFEESELTFIV